VGDEELRGLSVGGSAVTTTPATSRSPSSSWNPGTSPGVPLTSRCASTAWVWVVCFITRQQVDLPASTSAPRNVLPSTATARRR
jgi:hypothetical protein